tara:strand:+ start:8 stop:1876 length:1869 start_codon:yes stop_codon:yes gene_type:complete
MKKTFALINFVLLYSLQGQLSDSSSSYKEHFELAIKHYKNKRYQLAENEFKTILIEKRNFADPVSHFMLAKSLFHQDKMLDSKRAGDSYLNKYPDSKYAFNIKIMLSDILISKEKYSYVVEQLLHLRESLIDSTQLQKIDYRLLNSIVMGVNSSKIEQLLFLSENKVSRSILNLARSYRSLLDGNINDMDLSLSVINSKLLPPYYFDFYESLSLFLGVEVTAHGTIAVILPLSGKEREKGLTFLLGLSRMAMDYQHDLVTNFKIYDNQSEDINTLKLLNLISLDKSVVSILGYLSEVSNLAATSFSGSIPIMLSKSNYSELTILSENIYLLSTSSEIQAKLSAQYLVKVLGYQHIAVLSPADDLNKNYASYFIEELNQLGLDPVAVEWYYGRPENLNRQFSAIRKTAWSLVPKENPNLKYLDLEIDSLDALFDVDVADFMETVENISELNQMSKRDSLKVDLSTLEAIYMPINKQDLSFIGTQLPMYNLKTKIIGNESWMDIDILAQDIIGPHLQGLTVLSSEYPKFGMANSSDLDRVFSMGYDHGYFINSLIKISKKSRRQYKNLLEEGDMFVGTSSLIELGGLNKNENQIVRVLEYNKSKMRTIGYFNGKNLIENQPLAK